MYACKCTDKGQHMHICMHTHICMYTHIYVVLTGHWVALEKEARNYMKNLALSVMLLFLNKEMYYLCK